MHFPKEALMPRKSPILLPALLLVLAALAVPARLAATGPRNMIVFFEFRDDIGGIEAALETVFNRMVGPSDQLIIQSPARLYGFSPKTLARPKAELIAMMREKLRGDISQAAQNYQQVVKDLETAVRNLEGFVMPSDVPQGGGMGGSPETRDMSELFNAYRQGLANLAVLRKVNEGALRQLAGAFRGQKGENHVIVLFEREFRPVPRREALNILGDMPKFAFQANELFTIGNLKEPFDASALAEFFKEVPLTLHLVYVTGKAASATANLLENSGDAYSAFSKTAKATGGVCETTAEPADGLKAVMKAWKSEK
jgi:hypothetical protein